MSLCLTGAGFKCNSVGDRQQTVDSTLGGVIILCGVVVVALWCPSSSAILVLMVVLLCSCDYICGVGYCPGGSMLCRL